MNIKELAEQAGLDMTYPHCIEGTIDDLERFAELVAAAERELRTTLAQNQLDIADRAYFAGKQVGIEEVLAQPEPFKPDWDMIEPYHERIKELEIENEKLRQALAQGKQEPVAWLEHGGWGDLFVSTERKGSFPVWKSPPSKPEQGCCECGVTVSEGYALYCVKCVEPMFKKGWVSLTAEEIYNCWQSAVDENGFTKRKVYDAIEAALRSKNNG